jgi:uncharacterized protein
MEKMMKRVGSSFLAVLVFACVGWGQNAPADVPADKEDIQKLFHTLHLAEMMQNLMTTSMQQQKQLTHDTLKKKMPSMTEDEFKRMDVFIDEFAKTIDLNGMLGDMIPVYQRHLSKHDVSAMLAFYNTPTGQKLLREQPAMMSEGMQAMQPRMQKVMSDLMDRVEQMVREDSGKTVPLVAK